MPIIRYTAIGGVATGAHYTMLLALVEKFRLEAAPATVLGALFGAAVAYLGNRKFTFTRCAPHRRALPRFLCIAAAGATLNGAVVWTGTALLALHYFAAQIVATALALFVTYRLNRAWTFL